MAPFACHNCDARICKQALPLYLDSQAHALAPRWCREELLNQGARKVTGQPWMLESQQEGVHFQER